MSFLRQLIFVVVAGVLAVPTGGNAWAADKRIALVIGNGKYANAPELPNPVHDARAIAKALDGMGFETITGIDVDRDGMERLLRQFLGKAADAKIALLYYAGHGLQADGRNYLVPVDAKLNSASDLNFGTIGLDRILASLDDPTRANIIILDASRDNPLARNLASHLRSAAVGRGLAPYTALGTNTLIAFSTAPGHVARSGSGADSPFAASLVRHIATPGLEVRQMLTRVRADVARRTGDKQIPWDSSSLRGDVYLAGPPRAGAAATAPPAEDEGARVWEVTKDSTSPAVLAAFIRKFNGTPYADLARARLNELTRGHVAVATPSDRRVPTSTADAIRQARPAGTSIDPEVLRVVRTDPFFANAPHVRLTRYVIKASGKGIIVVHNNNTVRALGPGIFRLDSNNTWHVHWDPHGTYIDDRVSQEIYAANGLIPLVYRFRGRLAYPGPGNDETSTTTVTLVGIDHLTGHLFPLKVGHKFGYRTKEHYVNSDRIPPKADYVAENVNRFRCVVTERLAASEFYPDLTGDAFVVVCQRRFGTDKITNRYTHVFFRDLGIFLTVDTIDPRHLRAVDKSKHFILTSLGWKR